MFILFVLFKSVDNALLAPGWGLLSLSRDEKDKFRATGGGMW
jgi:hypothetical protein